MFWIHQAFYFSKIPLTRIPEDAKCPWSLWLEGCSFCVSGESRAFPSLILMLHCTCWHHFCCVSAGKLKYPKMDFRKKLWKFSLGGAAPVNTWGDWVKSWIWMKEKTDGCCLEAEKFHYIKSHCLSALGYVVSLFFIAKIFCLSQLGKSLSVRSVRLLNCCNCCFLSEDIEKAISFSYEQDVCVVIFETVIKETRRAAWSF